MSCIILVFLGKKLANFGSRDVEILGLLTGVFCALSVDFVITWWLGTLQFKDSKNMLIDIV